MSQDKLLSPDFPQAPTLDMTTLHPSPFSSTLLSQRYVPPDQVKESTYTKGSASTSVQGSIAEGKPLRTLLGDPVPSLSAAASTSSQCVSQTRTSQTRNTQPTPHSSGKKASTDLLADIGGDPFAAPQVAPTFAAFPAYGGQTPSHGAFASFDAFGSSPSTSAFGSIPPTGPGLFQAQPALPGKLWPTVPSSLFHV